MKRVTKLNSLSVFFPCYNEEGSIKKLIKEATSIIPTLAEKYEIIIVNDGSTDNTLLIAQGLAKNNPHIKVVSQKNQGYGGAVNTGLRTSKYAWIFFTDADLQFKLKDLRRFVKEAHADVDLVIGYRKSRAEGFKRAVFAEGMKIWNVLFLGFPWFIKDIDCAFKLIRKDVIDNVGDLKTRGNLVSTELLLSAYKLGYSFRQLGVSHYKRTSGVSKCGSLKDVLTVIRETRILRKIINERFVDRYRLLRFSGAIIK